MTRRKERESLRKETRKLRRFYAPAVRAHRGILLLGGSASLGVVGARAALPLPLSRVVEALGAPVTGGVEDTMARTVLLAGAGFLVLYAALGAFDLWSRVLFARFAISVVRDVRSTGMETLARPGSYRSTSADLITRLVGDTARLKDGLKGFLVHVATNGLFFIVVVVSLGFFRLRLAALMGAGLVLVFAVTAYSALLVYRRSITLRQRESKLAETILDAAGSGVSDPGQSVRLGSLEASLTRIQGRTALVVYFVLGVLLALCLASSGEGPDADTKRIAFSSYALILIHPVIRLSRQGTRLGKMLACAVRIERVARPAKRGPARLRLPELRESLVLEGLSRRGGRGRRNRVGPIDLALRPGERVAVVGLPGSGKTSLLRAIARPRRSDEGRIFCDGVELSSASERDRRVVLLTGRADLEAFLEQREPQSAPADPSAAWPDIVLVDEPHRGGAARDARRLLREVLSPENPCIVVAALSDRHLVDLFDRVVALRAGRIVYDGSVVAFQSEVAQGDAPGLASPHAEGPG